MAIRLITLDIDGTLLNPQGEVTPRVRQAVQSAVDRGCIVTLATGRRFSFAQHVAESLGIRASLVLHGGAVIQDSQSGRVIYEDVLSRPAYLTILDKVTANGFQPVVFESPSVGGRVLTGPEECDTVETKRYFESRRTFYRFSYDDLKNLDRNLSVSAMGQEVSLRSLYDEIAPLNLCHPWFSPPTIHSALPWHTVDMLAHGCCKAKAITSLSQALGVSLSEVMAVGDNFNDVDMIEAVGWGVAVGNALPEVKEVAKAIVATNAEDGVAEAIERFVLASGS